MARYEQGEFDFDLAPLITPSTASDNSPSPLSYNSYKKLPGVYDIIGQSVSISKTGGLTRHSWQKLHTILSIYRDKRYETFRYLLVNDKGYIKDHVAISAYLPGRTPISPNRTGADYFVYQVKKRAIEMNYKIVLVHNHTSGFTDPSPEDISVTDRLKEFLGDRYHGHIILDHGQFAYSAGNNSGFTQVQIPSPGPDPLIPEAHNDYTGFFIKHNGHEDFLRNAIRVDSGDKWNSEDWVPILFLNQHHVVQSLHYYHVTEFEGENADINILNKSIFIGRSEGSAVMYALPVNNDMFNMLSQFNDKLPIFMDIIYNGRSLALERNKSSRLSDYFSFDVSHSSTFNLNKYFHYFIPEKSAQVAMPQPPFPVPARKPESSPGSPSGKVRMKDAEEWANTQFPNIYSRYNTLQVKLTRASSDNRIKDIKSKINSLQSDFINTYQILHLQRFDESKFSKTANNILNAQNKKEFTHTPVHIGFLPQVYNDIGYPLLPAFITSRHLYLIANKQGIFNDFGANYHDIPKNIVLSLQSYISDPQMIIDLQYDKPTTLTLLNAYDKNNKQIGLYSTPLGQFRNANNIRFTAPLVFTMFGLDSQKLNDISNNLQNKALYIKKEAKIISPILKTALDGIGKGPVSNMTITPAQIPGREPDLSLGFSFLEDNINRFKQSVKTFLQQSPDTFRFVRENEPAYGGSQSYPFTAHKETIMADQTTPVQDSPMAVEYLDRLRSIRDPENRQAYHDNFVQIEAFSHLAPLPDFSRLEEQYQESLESFKLQFPGVTPPSSLSWLAALPLAPKTPWDFLHDSSGLASPEEYRSFYNDNYKHFVPGDIRHVSPGMLGAFVDGHTLPLALSADEPPYSTAFYKLTDEHGIISPLLIPNPDEVDRQGMSLIRDNMNSYARLLHNDYYVNKSQDTRRMQLEYLEMLIQADPDKRKDIHRTYAGISEFRLAGFPQFDRLEEQYRQHLDNYSKDFPDDRPPFSKKLIPLSQPAPGHTPLRFLQDASLVKSPNEYNGLYNQHYGNGLPSARVRMVSPDTIALLIPSQKLPAAMLPYHPDGEGFAKLSKLANHNGFVPRLNKSQQSLIPSPEEVSKNGAGIITAHLKDMNDFFSGPYHARRIAQAQSRPASGQQAPQNPGDPANPAKLFVNFVTNPFNPGVRVPAFGVVQNGALKLMEGYSFLRTEDSGHTVCLSKPGEKGLPETAKISKAHYDFIALAANTPAASKELTQDIIQKYEQTVQADMDKTRPNTAANFWHNYRVLVRKEALNPQDAMATARRVLYEMNFEERDKFIKSLESYEKLRGETYNDRITKYYDQVVKDIPLKNRSPHSGQTLDTLRHNDDSINTPGKPFDSRLRLKIGDPVKLNLTIPDLVTGTPKKVLKTDLYLASSSEKSNKVVIMSSDNTSKYIVPRDAFVKSMEAVEKRQEKQRLIEEKKEHRKSLKESVSVGW
jgi:hypothetical protein